MTKETGRLENRAIKIN